MSLFLMNICDPGRAERKRRERRNAEIVMAVIKNAKKLKKRCEDLRRIAQQEYDEWDRFRDMLPEHLRTEEEGKRRLQVVEDVEFSLFEEGPMSRREVEYRIYKHNEEYAEAKRLYHSDRMRESNTTRFVYYLRDEE